MAKRETHAEALVRVRETAYAEGFRFGKERAKAELTAVEQERASKVRLFNSVGQALDAQTRIVEALSHVLDNSGGMK